MTWIYIAVLCFIDSYVTAAYYYSNGIELSWDDAYEDCKARNMELAKIDSQSELDAAILYMNAQPGNDIKKDLWIGMRYDITSTPHVYRWINCEIPTFTIWSGGEPNYKLIDLCIRMDKDFSFQLRTTRCTNVLDYLCTGLGSVVTASYDDTVVLECPYCSDLPIMAVYWQVVNDTGITYVNTSINPEKYSGSRLNSTSLVVMHVDKNDIGSYICSVTNSQGTDVGTPVNITIIDEPSVTTPTVKYKAFYGDSMTIICEVFGQPEVTNVNWHITTQAGSIDFSGSWSTHYDGLYLPDLRVVRFTFQDVGNYTCSATNYVGTTTSQIITVKVIGVAINIPESSYTVIYGNNITLDCIITAIPELQNVSWKMENNGIMYDINTTNTLKYQGSTVENPALTILDTHFGNQGNYYCYGENGVDCKNSSFTVLTVFGGKPKVNVNQTVIYRNQSNTVTLLCEVTGVPDVTSVFWVKEVDGVFTSINILKTGNIYWPSLNIPSLKLSDNGDYTCHAVNEVGNTSSSAIRLEVLSSKPKVNVNQTVIYRNQSNTVTLFCEVTGVPDVTSVFWVKEVDGVFTSINIIKTGNIYWPSLNIPSLKLSDNGDYTCHAVNEVGNTSSSAIRLEVLSTEPMCPCSCDYKTKLDYWASMNDTNHTIDEWRVILAPVLAEIRVNLTVDVSTLTKTKNKYISATDSRSSSANIGAVGIAFILFIVVGLILMDITSCKRHIKTAKAASKHFK